VSVGLSTGGASAPEGRSSDSAVVVESHSDTADVAVAGTAMSGPRCDGAGGRGRGEEIPRGTTGDIR
jgi:hypothetical protein